MLLCDLQIQVVRTVNRVQINWTQSECTGIMAEQSTGNQKNISD